MLSGLCSIETNDREVFADFKRDPTNTDDAERSGRPSSAVVQENIKKVHKIVLADRKLKLWEIVETLKISEGIVFTILHGHLSVRKLCSKWVPRLLTVVQKQQRVDDSECCWSCFSRIKRTFS